MKAEKIIFCIRKKNSFKIEDFIPWKNFLGLSITTTLIIGVSHARETIPLANTSLIESEARKMKKKMKIENMEMLSLLNPV